MRLETASQCSELHTGDTRQQRIELKVLLTGRGTYGSWNIRGEQLGEAIGATVQPQAESAAGYDAVVIVKRVQGNAILRSARLHGVPVIWDVVDAWPQPQGDAWTGDASLAWLRQSIRAIRPDGIIAPTRRMAQDLVSIVEPGTAITTLAHHAWPGKPVNAIRPSVQSIGYQGGEKHLGAWSKVLSDEASRRGWQFVVNPPSLADVDIAIALRCETGYAPRNWKSNVKLANAQGSGTPIILARESGYLETASGAEFWADTAAELSDGLDWFSDHGRRIDASQRMLATAPRLADIAGEYRRWLLGICEEARRRTRRPPSPARRLYGMACALVSDRLRR